MSTGALPPLPSSPPSPPSSPFTIPSIYALPHRLVELVREEMAAARAQGRAPPVYGAKITGGGSGGTVCILGKCSATTRHAVAG